jgi:hypothetical protein
MLRRRPLVYVTLDNVSDSLGMHLYETLFAKLLDSERWHRSQKAAVANFFHSLSDAQN